MGISQNNENEDSILENSSSDINQTELIISEKSTNSTITTISSSQKEYEKSLEESKNSQLMPSTLINKKIEQGNVFGFIPDNGLQTGMNVIEVSDVKEKFSIRFTPKFSGEVTKLKLYLDHPNDVLLRVGIQEDIEGHPNGSWLGGVYLEKNLGSDKNKFDEFEFSPPITLKHNQVYHIVGEIPSINDQKFFLLTYNENWQFTPFNHQDPDLVWEDKAINTLFFDGATWSTQEKWPIFVIEYEDGTSYGQPFSLMAPWVIKGPGIVGQTIMPFSNYLVDEFAFVVSLDGNPNDDLHYQVYDEENKIIRNGVFATANDLTQKKSWHFAKLDPPVYLDSGHLYRFTLSSPNADIKNPYKVYGHEFMMDQTISYGSIKHYLTKSLDGINWSKWYDADAAFKLITK